MALVYTDYGYGHIDLQKYMHDLELPQDLFTNLVQVFSELPITDNKKEEVKDEVQIVTERKLPAQVDKLELRDLKDLKQYLSHEKYNDIEKSFDKIIRVNFRNGAIGGIRRRNISSKITLQVKTMHGKRTTHNIQVSIFDKVELIIEKLSEIEPDEMLKYYSSRLLYCMGKLQTLKLDQTFESLNLKNRSQILLLG